jgi:hypothetical protein
MIFCDGKECVRMILLTLRRHGYLTQAQWDAVDGPLAPRPSFFGMQQLESDEIA